ncbi:MAG: nucleoside deaminase [Mycolicibacterium sp.]|uniref:nucleoside deaminase n=1 Tax=Mycolicibacterium sp. TaxID=2320850 RepID=UPI003D121310
MTRRQLLRYVAAAPATALFAPTAAASLTGCSQPSELSGPGQRLRDAEQAASLVLSMAEKARRQGTFGVGGALVENATGRVFHAMHNTVVQSLGMDLGPSSGTAFVRDPTAHAELKLVNWYFATQGVETLPDPSALTVVTSLDPCAMCAGALMTAGFNVAVVAYDDFAGVNWNMKNDFPDYPAEIHDRLLAFGYYADEAGRAYFGPPDILFADSSVTDKTADGCETVFTDNLSQARDAVSASGLNPRDRANATTDPATLPENSIFRLRYQEAFGQAFSVRLADYRRPDERLQNHLQALVKQTPQARNAVAFIDYYGNLLMSSADRFDQSPVATAFMTAVQQYSALRFSLMNDPETVDSARKSLHSAKYGTFVFLFAPDGFTTTSLMDLGAYGSAMESAVPVKTPSGFQFYQDPATGSLADLNSLIRAMPPFYGPALVDIAPQKVAS